MKIAALHLLAFGPFTDKTVTLDGPANLHLIYGPNEAGKSSALRAMSDLRFGIQLRTADNFVHANDRLTIGGTFETEAGERIELLRTKGRNATLVHADPLTRRPDASRPVSGEHEAALTGGLGRSDFAAMFGLDHERLREGGRQLLRGDGELGAALFEVSAGTRGIAALVGGLEDDAKLLFNPRGNARNAVMNDAGRQFEEARKAWREAMIKPAEWQQRKRRHDDARALLDELVATLASERRRLNELVELRSVEPLLRELDASMAELAALAGVPLLDESAREQRMAAEPELLRADADAAEAQLLVDVSERALSAIEVDDTLIRHAAAIERLSASIETASRSRLEAGKLEAGVERMQADLHILARRIAGKGALPDDVLEAVPSPVEHRALAAHFTAIDELGIRLRMLRQQTTEASEQLARAAESRAESMPDPGLRVAVLEALTRAQALGDVEQRLRDADRQRRELSMQLSQTVSDLEMTVSLVESLAGGPSAIDVQAARAAVSHHDELKSQLRIYRAARPLLAAEIEAARRKGALREELHRKVALDIEVLQRDVDVQRRRLVQLSAAGEVVTADMLRDTRLARDEMWARLRTGLVDRAGGRSWSATPDLFDAAPPAAELVASFETSQSDADRQADLLRADAERAAIFEECRLRIEQMLEQQAEKASIETRLGIEERNAAQAWTEQLRESGLPINLHPAALQEWQTLRSALLEKADRLASLNGDREHLLAAVSGAARDLGIALEGSTPDTGLLANGSAAGADLEDGPIVAAGSVVELARLMRRAAANESAAVRQTTDFEARTAALEARRQALVQGRAAIAQAEADIVTHRRGVADWLARAFLEPEALPEQGRARLSELAELQTLALDAASLRQRHQEQVAVGRQVLTQALHVANLVGDEAPTIEALADYADELGARLRLHLEADRQRRQVLVDLKRGQGALVMARAAATRLRVTLARLCHDASVDDVGALRSVEDASARKRKAKAAVADQRALLMRASTKAQESLRARLGDQDAASLDADLAACRLRLVDLETQHASAAHAEQQARTSLESIDSSDAAAHLREQMEQAAARYRGSVLPWARLKLAHALLQESLKRFRDRAQAPMVKAASRYFALMTGGRYVRLVATDDEDKPMLLAERADGRRIAIDAMSEGTGDQLFLALRLAALELRRASHPAMPLVLDDVLMTSDDERTSNILRALAEFSAHTQVLVFTHHRHVLEVGRAALCERRLALHEL